MSKEINIDIISKFAKARKAASLCFCVNLLGRVTAQGVWMDSYISFKMTLEAPQILREAVSHREEVLSNPVTHFPHL